MCLTRLYWLHFEHFWILPNMASVVYNNQQTGALHAVFGQFKIVFHHKQKKCTKKGKITSNNIFPYLPKIWPVFGWQPASLNTDITLLMYFRHFCTFYCLFSLEKVVKMLKWLFGTANRIWSTCSLVKIHNEKPSLGSYIKIESKLKT